MGEKWFCIKCGQENDALFCIKCGSPRPETAMPAEAAAAVETPAAEAAAKTPAASPAAAVPPAADGKKKKRILPVIIAAAAVVVAAVVVVLFLFVFNKKEKAYENEAGNYSITVPAGYKMTEYDNGIVATKKNAALFVDFVESAPPNGAIVYDWYDFLRYKYTDRPGMLLKDALGITDVEDSILDPATFGDENFYSYSMTAVCEDGTPATGEFYIYDSDSIGCYLVCYYMKNDISEKKAEQTEADFAQFLDSFVINGAPNIPGYEVIDMNDDFLGQIAVRSELISDYDIGGRSCRISDPSGKEQIMIELIYANSILEIFSWEGIRDAQIISSSSDKITDVGRFTYDAFHAEYRDDDNNKRFYGIYGNFADNKTPGVFAVEYDVPEDKTEWAEEVCQDILWSWHFEE